MVRILKTNGPVWAFQLVRSDNATEGRKAVLNRFSGETSNVSAEEFDKAYREQAEIDDYKTHKAVVSYNRDTVVTRNALVNTYIHLYFGEFNVTENGYIGFKDVTDKNFQQRRIEIQSIIQSCIDSQNAFISVDKGDSSRVFLTVKGKKFADLSCVGLVKEWAREIGMLWAGIVWILSVISAANWKYIINFIIKFIHT